MSGSEADLTMRSSVTINPPQGELDRDGVKGEEVVEGSATEEGIISKVCLVF